MWKYTVMCCEWYHKGKPLKGWNAKLAWAKL